MTSTPELRAEFHTDQVQVIQPNQVEYHVAIFHEPRSEWNSPSIREKWAGDTPAEFRKVKILLSNTIQIGDRCYRWGWFDKIYYVSEVTHEQAKEE